MSGNEAGYEEESDKLTYEQIIETAAATIHADLTDSEKTFIIGARAHLKLDEKVLKEGVKNVESIGECFVPLTMQIGSLERKLMRIDPKSDPVGWARVNQGYSYACAQESLAQTANYAAIDPERYLDEIQESIENGELHDLDKSKLKLYGRVLLKSLNLDTTRRDFIVIHYEMMDGLKSGKLKKAREQRDLMLSFVDTNAKLHNIRMIDPFDLGALFMLARDEAVDNILGVAQRYASKHADKTAKKYLARANRVAEKFDPLPIGEDGISPEDKQKYVDKVLKRAGVIDATLNAANSS